MDRIGTLPRTYGRHHDVDRSPALNICVFLSAADLDEHWTRPAREFAQLLGGGGHTLVWGVPTPGW